MLLSSKCLCDQNIDSCTSLNCRSCRVSFRVIQQLESSENWLDCPAHVWSAFQQDRRPSISWIKLRDALQNVPFVCNYYELLSIDLRACLFFVVKKKKKKKKTDLKMGCSKKTCQECEVSSIFAPNQLLPNVLHHVRGKRGESAVIIPDCFSILSLICGASLMAECCLNRTWSTHWAFVLSAICPTGAKQVDRNVVIYPSRLCKIKNTLYTYLSLCLLRKLSS